MKFLSSNKIQAAFTTLFFLILSSLGAQNLSISGTVSDSANRQPVSGVVLTVSNVSDTSRILGGTQTDTSGFFRISGLSTGQYRMKIRYPGYHSASRIVTIGDSSVHLGTITIKPSGLVMKGVTIEDAQIRVSQNGDTTEFKANAFKTNPDATAEDLVRKMPGVTNENGTTKVNGEEVKQVTVDGKTYFGDDPNAALKNIPADMIESVQVFDRASDQAQFTGFDDGKSSKTINIVTKKNNMIGQFGKVFAGYGTDDRFNAGFTLNAFDTLRRVTILGISNNINQQNFSMADISGMLNSSQMGPGMRAGMMSGRGPVRGPAANFVVGAQNGISTTHAFGLNYSEDWTPKMKASGSYFFNYSDNANNSTLTRNYFTTNDTSLVYNETSDASTRNINHRFNFRFEYTIDSMNSLIISPRFTSQFTDYSKNLSGLNLLAENTIQSSTATDNASVNQSYNVSNSITYRHRFKKRGRTISADLSTSWNNRNGDGVYYSRNIFELADTTTLDQFSTLKSDGYTINPVLSWTEPAGKYGQLQFTYDYSTTLSRQDKNTYNRDTTGEAMIDSSLTNQYENTYTTQRGGLTYNLNYKKLQLSGGANVQFAGLNGILEFPAASTISKKFVNVLPSATIEYKFSKRKNLKIRYRTSTNAPSMTQLQNVLDNSNPLQLRIGNPDLKQTYEHTLMTHYGVTNPQNATGIFVFIYGSLTQDYVANSTFIASSDTLLPEGIFLNKGSQLIRQVNLDGYRSLRSFVTYSMPLKKLKSNLGITLGASYSRTPALINGETNIGQTTNLGPGFTFSSNISEKVDFTLAYSGNYNIVRNTLQTQSNSNYFSHTATFRFNWIFYKGFFLNSSVDQTFYSGLGEGYNTNYTLVNGAIGYKFFPKRTLEVKFSVFDLLKQNTSVSRSITETYIEDSSSNALQQYYMLTLTWNIKHFKGGSANSGQAPANGQTPPMPPPPPGGNPPPPPPGN